MSPVIGLTIDIVMLCALAFTIFYGFTLSKKFDDLRSDRKAFEQLITALNLAASRAEAAIRSLKEAATTSGDKLQEKVGVARALAEELEIVVEAGDNLAERLTALAEKSGRAHTPEVAEPTPASMPQDKTSGTQPRTRAEKELLDALKARQQS